MTAHTPGPWAATKNGGAWLVVSGAWDVAGNDDHPERRGEVAHARYSAMSNEENAANARLIAAAPDLLAALEPFSHEYVGDAAACHRGITSVEKCLRCQRIIAARNAIAKARGEAVAS